jgi:hypothetical protein
VRIAGIVLLVLAALLVVPSLAIAAWIAIGETRTPWSGEDPYGVRQLFCYAAAILGGCIGVIGGLAVWVGRKRSEGG